MSTAEGTVLQHQLQVLLSSFCPAQLGLALWPCTVAAAACCAQESDSGAVQVATDAEAGERWRLARDCGSRPLGHRQHQDLRRVARAGVPAPCCCQPLVSNLLALACLSAAAACQHGLWAAWLACSCLQLLNSLLASQHSLTSVHAGRSW